MPDVYLYEGCANPKDVKLREAGAPPPPAIGYPYSDGLVCVHVGG